MTVERYSHVMHIVSTVVGRVARRPQRVRRAGRVLPRGHAVRRAQAARDGDSSRSWSRPAAACTAACVGYLDFAGDLDIAIAIRTAVVRDGVAYVQAGGGIVADSDPAAEDAECRNKAAAVLRAVAVAESIRPVIAEHPRS